MALAGPAKGKPFPPLGDTGSIGVYAEGANAELSQVLDFDDNTKLLPAGPLFPGVGVLGRGGVPIPSGRLPVAAGVVGLAGGLPIPNIGETGNCGVYGAGPTGVSGHGPIGVRGQADGEGPGVHGVAAGGRGGQFESTRSAQVQLVPQELGGPLPAPVNVTPQAIPVDREGPLLPKDGRAGDLMTVIDDQRRCTLWFCLQGGNGGPARWAQVLLGPAFAGQV